MKDAGGDDDEDEEQSGFENKLKSLSRNLRTEIDPMMKKLDDLQQRLTESYTVEQQERNERVAKIESTLQSLDSKIKQVLEKQNMNPESPLKGGKNFEFKSQDSKDSFKGQFIKKLS